MAAAEFCPGAFGMTDHHVEFDGFDNENTMTGWNLIVTVDSGARLDDGLPGCPAEVAECMLRTVGA